MAQSQARPMTLLLLLLVGPGSGKNMSPLCGAHPHSSSSGRKQQLETGEFMLFRSCKAGLSVQLA